MSAIGGAFSFDGQPLSNQVLQCMKVELARRGSDAEHFILGSNFAALMHEYTTYNTPPIDNPFVTTTGIVAMIDGRIDNRLTLITKLSDEIRRLQPAWSCPESSETLPNALIVYAAYLKWGNRLIDFLRGDFFFAIRCPR